MRVHPDIISTGGLEAVAGALIAMDSRYAEREESAIDAAGSLDAPQSMPAGCVRRYAFERLNGERCDHVGQLWSIR